ncbi:unnamed protein product [Cuscuta epithymum]|uniref:Uncharacterized protein n=1 Tax=Cuscuta epithymum TaxID=186058 RepID=A0AAV0GLM7_9ASTE|nr:unnamed protein product [Cuscuta epithymum]CAH9148883.1 unnamed protein product [Cuscuta epithymum]
MISSATCIMAIFFYSSHFQKRPGDVPSSLPLVFHRAYNSFLLLNLVITFRSVFISPSSFICCALACNSTKQGTCWCGCYSVMSSKLVRLHYESFLGVM